MRAFDIICVVVLTRLLLLTSNVSSTPTTYSTSNPHSLISGDTHDGIRALRVSDESSTQERGLSNLDPILKLLPWTDVYTAAKVSKLKNSLGLTKLTKNDIDSHFEAQLTNMEFKKQLLEAGLANDIKPKIVESLLLKHVTSMDDITETTELYTKAYEHYKSLPRRVRNVENPVNKVLEELQAKENELAIQKENLNENELAIQKENLNNWMKSLLTEDGNGLDQITTMLKDNIKPDDLKKKFWRDKTEEDEIDPFLEFYAAMYEKYKAHPLMNENPSQAADLIVEDTKDRIAYFKNRLRSVREGKQEMGKDKERMFSLLPTFNNKVDDFLLKRYSQELNKLGNGH